MNFQTDSNKSQTTLIRCPSSKAGSYTISNNVTSIRSCAFFSCTSLTNVTIPNSVTNLGDKAFQDCSGLNNIAIPNSVTSIGGGTFSYCSLLASVTIPNSVSSIGSNAFSDCTNLTNVTIPDSVTNIGSYAFSYCTILTGVYFQGNAPGIDGWSVFYDDNNATVYYLPGTTGWWGPKGEPWFGGRPTVLWNPQAQTNDGSFGVRTNSFGFNIRGSSNLVVVVESCSNLASPVWSLVGTNTLNIFIGTNGTSYFSDPQWTNYPGRFYRFRSP